jgi:hypothetical protein
VAEQQLAHASAENARLRDGHSEQSVAVSPAYLHENVHTFANTFTSQRIAGHDDLATQLRDTKWRLQQLETQYDHATSKASAQMEAFKMAEEQLEVGRTP